MCVFVCQAKEGRGFLTAKCCLSPVNDISCLIQKPACSVASNNARTWNVVITAVLSSLVWLSVHLYLAAKGEQKGSGT